MGINGEKEIPRERTACESKSRCPPRNGVRFGLGKMTRKQEPSPVDSKEIEAAMIPRRRAGFACRTAGCRGSLACGPPVRTAPHGSGPTTEGAEEPVPKETDYFNEPLGANEALAAFDALCASRLPTSTRSAAPCRCGWEGTRDRRELRDLTCGGSMTTRRERIINIII
jgi:hypothetical protein